jgi:hypothetical protein
MSWYTGSISNAVGGLIAVLDVELIKNSHWTIFDAAAGVNAKVYKCEDPDDGTLFYWYVDDNVSADYAQTKTYETWDAGAHAGTGGLSSFVSFRHKLGTYNISLDDTQVIYIDTDVSKGNGCFVGRIKVVDPTIQQEIALIGHVTSLTTWNPLTGVTGDGNALSLLLRGPTGVASESLYWVGFTGPSAVMFGEAARFSLDINGHAWFNKGWVHTRNRLLGFIEGVIPLGSTGTYAHGDIISIGGEDWIAVTGETNGYALVKK